MQEAFTGLVHALRNFGAHDALVKGTSWCTAGAPTPPTGRSQWRSVRPDPHPAYPSAPHRRGGDVRHRGPRRAPHRLGDRRPATGLCSATVVGPELTWADVYATAVFVKGPTALAWVASLARHAAILVDTDGVVSSVRSPLD